ncbi:MAG TPA: hypothetical protein VLA54_04810 [Acidimicrobiia bacterium]|nr:hypothetical protein [Acidimicrobiia bacterium]
MDAAKGLGTLAALVGLGYWMRRRQNRQLQEAISSNWKDLKAKLPTEWSEVAPKKRKQAGELIDNIHRSTGESRRRIRRTLQGLTA